MNEGKSGRDVSIGVSPVSHRVVTEATTLTGNDEHVKVTIPLASASDYDVTLPPLSERPGQKIFISCVRANGSYSDGGVQVVDQSDGITVPAAVGLTNDKLTTPANGDHVYVENVMGLFWHEISELTT